MTSEIIKSTRKWWFWAIVVLLNFIPPIATKNFSLDDWGTIIYTTLPNALNLTDWKAIQIPFQIIFIVILLINILTKGKISKFFAGFIAFCYLLFAIGQNIAVTEKYGLSMISMNIILFGAVALAWLNEFIVQRNKYDFVNWKISYLWLIILSVIAFWHPINYSGIPALDLHPKYFVIGGSALAFCLTTPLLLTMMTLNIPNINLLTYRITAIVGTIIGFYNMLSFFNPNLFWLAAIHIPLVTVSLFCLVKSYQIENKSHSR